MGRNSIGFWIVWIGALAATSGCGGDSQSSVRRAFELDAKFEELGCACGGYVDGGYASESACVQDVRMELASTEFQVYLGCVDRAANQHPYAKSFLTCALPVWQRSYSCREAAACDVDAADACSVTEEAAEDDCDPCAKLTGAAHDNCIDDMDAFDLAAEDCSNAP